MKLVRLLLASLILWSGPAEAKVLLVGQERSSTQDCSGGPDCANSKLLLNYTVALLEKFGVDYKIVDRAEAQTEFLRSGDMVWRYGTAGAYVEHFDAVIHTTGTNYILGPRGVQRADSLGLANLAGGYPAVPQIFLGDESNFQVSAGRCSTGASAGAVNTNTYYNGIVKYLATDPSLRWRSGFLDGVKLTYTPAGGARVLIAQNVGAALFEDGANAAGAGNPGIPCGDCDSVVATSDSVLMWSRLFNNVTPPAAQIIYCVWNHTPALQMDPAMPLMALAYADSLTGGKVFENKTKLPATVGFHVRGGWRRSQRHVMGGISPNDSTTLKASIDSIAALRVPFVVGVNVDSLAIKTDDRNWWLRAAPYVHFTPEMRGGLDSAVAGNDAASWQQPRDVFGRYRNRFIRQAGNDTSVSRLARAAFWKCDSAFGRNSVDRLIIPPDDDWWPYNWRRANSNGASIDSIFAALSDSVGATGIVISPWADGDHQAATNRKSPIRSQRAWDLVTSGRSTGTRFNVLATTPPQDSGSARWNRGYRADSYDPGSFIADCQSFLMGAFGFGHRVEINGLAGGLTAITPRDSVVTQTSIFTIHAGDLGTGVHASGRATRSGYWAMKYIVNSIKAINRFAGRTIVSIEYPENVKP